MLHILSLVGSVFFSSVSVFFSLDLSKDATSEMSGLSDMSAEALEKKKKKLSFAVGFTLNTLQHLGVAINSLIG